MLIRTSLCVPFGVVCLLLHFSGHLSAKVGAWVNLVFALGIQSAAQYYSGGIASPVQLGPSLFAAQVRTQTIVFNCNLRFRHGLVLDCVPNLIPS